MDSREQAERVLRHYKQMVEFADMFVLHLHNIRITPDVLSHLREELWDLSSDVRPRGLSFAYTEFSPNAEDALSEFCQSLIEVEEVMIAGDGQNEVSVDDYYFVLTALRYSSHIHTLEIHLISDLYGETLGELLSEIAFLKCTSCSMDVDFVRGFASNSLRSSPPQSLVFYMCQFTDEMLSVLAFENVWRDNSLEELDLTNNQLTLASLPALTALLQQNSESLETLVLGGNAELFAVTASITPELQEFLDCLANNTGLVDLRLFDCNLNNQVVSALFQALKQNNTLEKLDLFSAEATFGVSGLEKSLPKLRGLGSLLLPSKLCQEGCDWMALETALAQNSSLTTIQLYDKHTPEWNQVVSFITRRNKGIAKAQDLLLSVWRSKVESEHGSESDVAADLPPLGLWPFFTKNLLEASTGNPNASAAYLFYRGTVEQTLLQG